MGTLQSSGAISLSQVQSALGGANPISFSEYYRGGSYVPSSRTTSSTPREPSSGEYYSGSPKYGCHVSNFYGTYYQPSPWRVSDRGFWWAGTQIMSVGYDVNYTSYTSGSATYYRGSLRYTTNDGYGGYVNLYGIYRYITYYSTVSINTSVPSSGQISLSQLYGAANP